MCSVLQRENRNIQVWVARDDRHRQRKVQGFFITTALPEYPPWQPHSTLYGPVSVDLGTLRFLLKSDTRPTHFFSLESSEWSEG